MAQNLARAQGSLGTIKMRICLLNSPIEFYSPISGGAVTTILMQSAKQLIALGHDVTILSPLNGNEVYPVGRVIEVDSRVRDDLKRGFRSLVSLHSWMMGWDWAYYRYYLKSFMACLRDMKPAPDIVIVFNDLVSPKYIKRVVPTAKTVVWLQNAQQTRLRSLKKPLESIDKYLACSTFIKDYLVGRYGLAEDAISVVNSGVDLDAFRPAAGFLEPQSPLRTLFIGRLDPNKGADLAADAVASLQLEGLKIDLTVAGGIWFYLRGNEHTDEYVPTLQRKLEAINATFTGYVARHDVPALIREHDVAFVLSRNDEPFGLVTLEAMASGCAVMASNRGGLPEACGGGAILVDPDNMEQIIDALRLLATDPEQLNTWKQKAVARASRASWESVGTRLNTILRTVK